MTRVLLAEDDHAISEPLARALRREGYDVEVCEDGPGAGDLDRRVRRFVDRKCRDVALGPIREARQSAEIDVEVARTEQRTAEAELAKWGDRPLDGDYKNLRHRADWAAAPSPSAAPAR